jgi:hypothetical protein
MTSGDPKYLALEVKFAIDRMVKYVDAGTTKMLIAASLIKYHVERNAVEDWATTPILGLFEYYMSMKEFIAMMRDRFGASPDADIAAHMKNHPVEGIYELNAEEIELIDALISAIIDWEKNLQLQYNITFVAN